MRIPSGKTDQLIFFVALDSNDLYTRKTGLSAFTVYRSRNGGTATVYTTPTIAELSAANMPGVYALTIDEDTTIASSSDSEEMALHITCSTMAPVTRTIELYRRDTTSGKTALIDSSGRVDVAAVAGTAQTARDLGASVLVGDKTGFSLSSGGVQAIWDALTSALTTSNSIGKRIVDYLTGDAYARLGAPAGASHAADVAAVKSDTAAVKTKTDSLTFGVAGVVDANIVNVNDVAVIGDGSATPWGPAP